MFKWVWLTDLTTYYLRLERLAIPSFALFVVAFVSFGMIAISFELKAILFVVYSAVLFNLVWITDRIFGKTTLTPKDVAITEEIRNLDLPLEEQEKLIRERIPSRYWQAPALIILVWCLLLSLLITLGGARYLAQFSTVQEIAGLIPSDIFLDVRTQRSEDEILLLKIYKITDVISFPFMAWAACALAMPFWQNPENFRISPMLIYRNEEMTAFQKIRRSLWTVLAFLVLLFGVVSWLFYLVANGYAGEVCYGFTNCKNNYGETLGISTWYSANGSSIVYGVMLSALIKIIKDFFSLIVLLFKKVRGA